MNDVDKGNQILGVTKKGKLTTGEVTLWILGGKCHNIGYPILDLGWWKDETFSVMPGKGGSSLFQSKPYQELVSKTEPSPFPLLFLLEPALGLEPRTC